jgi:tetratricopeptide (TPR) repeat protein
MVYGVAALFAGLMIGYVIGQQRAMGAPAVAAAEAPHDHPTVPAATTVADEGRLKAYRDILAQDPKNAKAATELANLLYDAGRYAEAVPYYQQAFALDPRDVGVSTDLGTAMWYTGRPDEALAQFDRSLAIDPKHPQTLFNIGIVRLEGKKDRKGAVEAWEKLLAAVPEYPEAEKVRTLIAQAR